MYRFTDRLRTTAVIGVLSSVAVVVCTAIAPAKAQTVISDQDFAPGDWEEYVLANPSGTGSYQTSQDFTGNPSPARSHVMTLQSGPSNFRFGQDFIGANYEPQLQGPIAFADVSFDVDFVSAVNAPMAFYTVSITQEGAPSYLYVSTPRVVTDTVALGWYNWTLSGLTADSFTNLSPGPIHPDFSSSGGLMYFGIACQFTGPLSGMSTQTTLLDNFTIRLFSCVGDPLCDGVRADIQDVVATIGVAFRGAPAVVDQSCGTERTDVDCSGATDIQDVVRVVNVAFRGLDIVDQFCLECP